LKIENSIFKIHKLDSVESTNKYCEALDLHQVEDFTCYWALEQTAGIGQRGNHWASAPGENLTFSLVLHPMSLAASRQFKLTQALSLALSDFLSIFNFQFPIRIKWPNDIYVRMSNTTEGSERHPYRKICGTLVSTRLQGDTIASAVCGIGLNVNQTAFPDWVPNPTSLRLLTGSDYDLEATLRALLERIRRRYDALCAGADMQQEYLAHLMNLGCEARYGYLGREITAVITGVDDHGRLLLDSSDGRRLCCAMKEITFLP
jgi:BirA family biotin operon repressor/biotin-[acetyl-CoA-carboxylase] ligase